VDNLSQVQLLDDLGRLRKTTRGPKHASKKSNSTWTPCLNELHQSIFRPKKCKTLG
jgi:hypothetical protein